MKVSELTGAELDYWVSRAVGDYPLTKFNGAYQYSPYSTEWSEGGPIIEHEKIVWTWVRSWTSDYGDGEYAVPCGAWEFKHKSPLVAVMRLFVFRKFGEEVDDSQAHNVQSR